MENHFRFMRLCAWGCILYIIIFGGFWGVLGQNIPPLSAAYPTNELAAHFIANAATFRIAFVVAAATCALYMTWSVGLFCVMRMMEKPGSVLSYIQLMAGSLTTLIPMLACIFWLAASFRPETQPDIIQALYDVGWLIMDCTFSVTTVQMVAFGILALQDKRPIPLFPKWLAWLGIWSGLEFFAEFLMPYFRTGPFSWVGLFGYWLAFFLPFAWMTLQALYMLRAITRLEGEQVSSNFPLGNFSPQTN